MSTFICQTTDIDDATRTDPEKNKQQANTVDYVIITTQQQNLRLHRQAPFMHSKYITSFQMIASGSATAERPQGALLIS